YHVFIGTRIAQWPPTEDFRYGYHNVISVCYLASSAVLMSVGLYLAVEAIWKLIEREHPTIGVFEIGDWQFWFGWLMIAILGAIAIPVFFIGRAKAKVARELYDKVLFADAEIDRADWLTEAAAIAGVVGIGFGYWWADA